MDDTKITDRQAKTLQILERCCEGLFMRMLGIKEGVEVARVTLIRDLHGLEGWAGVEVVGGNALVLFGEQNELSYFEQFRFVVGGR